VEGGAGPDGAAAGAAGATGSAGSAGATGDAGITGAAVPLASWMSPFTVTIFSECRPPFTSPETRLLPRCE
jgi:hypothetical protein